MLEQCKPPTALSKPVSCMEKKFCSPSSLPCVSMRCLCNPDRTYFFFFCHPFARPPCPSLLRGGGCFFSHPGLPLTLDSSTTGLHSSNRVENPSCRCCAPTRFSKPHAGPQGAFLFHAHSLLAFPLQGKANLFPNLACPGFLDSLTTAPHGSNRAGNPFCWCRSLPGLQNRTQGHTEASLVSPIFLRVSLFWQSLKIPLQLVIHFLLDGSF